MSRVSATFCSVCVSLAPGIETAVVVAIAVGTVTKAEVPSGLMLVSETVFVPPMPLSFTVWKMTRVFTPACLRPRVYARVFTPACLRQSVLR